MQGIVIFHSLDEALEQGYIVLDRIAEGYLVRKQTPNGFALAMVVFSEN